MTIRELCSADLAEWVRLRHALWPDAPMGEMERECREFLAGVRRASLPEAVFVVDRGDGRLGGFQEMSVRGAVEGCATGSVAYLGALLVDRDLRKQGWARKLVDAAEDWAKRKGCLEIASDVLAGNHTSHRVHLKLGYGHTRALIGFRKPLAPAGMVTPASVHTSLLAEPIDPASVVSLVKSSNANTIRMAAAVVAHQLTQDGHDLAGEEFVERQGARELLARLAATVHREHRLTRVAVIIRSGYVAVGEVWGVAAASADDAHNAAAGAEELLSKAATNALDARKPLWRETLLRV